MPNLETNKPSGYDENELAQARELGYDAEEYDRGCEWLEEQAQHHQSFSAKVVYLRG